MNSVQRRVAWHFLLVMALLASTANCFSHPEKSAGVLERRSWLQKSMIAVCGGLAVQPAVAATEEPYKVLLKVQLDKETSGEIEIEVMPEWAPLAASRFRELIDLGFYTDAPFFRVLPGFIAQFGISPNPELNKEWLLCEKRCKAIPDEPKMVPNKKGTLTFASSGKNSRQTQIFINLNNNDGPPNFLDSQGFVPFARVTKGMDTVVSKINSEYGIKESLTGGLTGSVNQGKAAYYGKEYFDAIYPNLSVIQSIKVL